MKDPTLEKKIQAIERGEKRRQMRAVYFAGKKRKDEGDSRTAAIKRMITKAKQAEYAQKREDISYDCGAAALNTQVYP
ncbi:hypothetical protein C8Q77DRAFT_1158115 [Trametes polyzona]|nr:hypothetical protein C8Q77DRAFT_1158115 [Trametes polyzona]